MSPQPNSVDPDADLLPGLKLGQEVALKAMMDRHLRGIHGLAWHMLGDASLAEDVAQESFVKLWQAAPRWKPGHAKMVTWLRRVATNACLDRLRRKGPVLMEHLPEPVDPSQAADEVMVSDERARLMRAAINSLPARQKAAITLAYDQGLSQSEGADILGVSQKAYESLLVRGKANLRRALSLSELENGDAA